MTDQDQKRWDRLRRAMLNIVAQQHAADPHARYTLRIEIIEKAAAEKVA